MRPWENATPTPIITSNRGTSGHHCGTIVTSIDLSVIEWYADGIM